VRTAAAEYNDVVASSAKRQFRASEAARLALHWLSGRGLPIVAGSIFVIAVLGAFFAFGVDPGRVRRRLVAGELMSGGRPQPKPSLPKLSRALENSLQVTAVGTPLSNTGRQPPVPQKAALLSRSPTTSPPKTALGKPNGLQVSPTNAHIKSLETSGKALPALVLTPVEEKTAASAPKSVPNDHVRSTIRYDIDRAEAALRDGRYNNAIWHLERAVTLDPDNQALRDRLSNARRAKAASHRAAIPSSVPSTDTIRSTASAIKRSKRGGIDIVKYEIYQGDAYMQKGEYDNALQKFKAALAIDPENAALVDKIRDAEKSKAAKAKTLPSWLLKIGKAAKSLKFWDSPP
jgi:hypothetical protein